MEFSAVHFLFLFVVFYSCVALGSPCCLVLTILGGMLVLKYSFSTTVCARFSSKLERYQLEEQRLWERVRELAEQNVLLQKASFNERDAASNYSFEVRRLREQVRGLAENNVQLQREVSAYRERDAESKSKITCFEQELEDLSKRVEDMNEENQDLKRNLLELQENNRAAEEELESFRLEVDSLQHENTDLQDLSKGNGKENEGFTVRLDKEMWTRVCCLQNQGPAFLNESSRLCSELLEFIKGEACQLPGAMQESEVIKHGLDADFVVESEMKFQGLRRGIENVTGGLQKIFVLFHGKSNPAASTSQSKSVDANGIMQSKWPMPEVDEKGVNLNGLPTDLEESLKELVDLRWRLLRLLAERNPLLE